jgi:hypothetical protein
VTVQLHDGALPWISHISVSPPTPTRPDEVRHVALASRQAMRSLNLSRVPKLERRGHPVLHLRKDVGQERSPSMARPGPESEPKPRRRRDPAFASNEGPSRGPRWGSWSRRWPPRRRPPPAAVAARPPDVRAATTPASGVPHSDVRARTAGHQTAFTWNRHLDDVGPLVDHSTEPEGRSMTGHRAWSHGEHCGPDVSAVRNRAGEGGINPRMQPSPPACHNLPSRCARRQPRRE